MNYIDADGKYALEEGSLKPKESSHPVWKARNAVALEKGTWLYAPAEGHELGIYRQKKHNNTKAEEFQKAATLYLQPYGAAVQSRLIQRGEASFSFNIPEET